MAKPKQPLSSKRIVGISMFVVGLLMPMTQIPQIKILYSTQVTKGLSIETWVMYLLFGFVPLTYAIVYRLTPLILSNILWIVVDVIMIAGIIKFGSIGSDSSFATLIAINSIGKLLSMVGFLLISSALVLFSMDLLTHRHEYEKAT